MRVACTVLLLGLGCGTSTTVSSGRLPVPAHPSAYVVTGRLIDSQHHVPVTAAFVIGPPSSSVETQSDSTGFFQLRLATRPGCYALRVRRIGYGATVRSVSLAADSLIALGQIPVRPAAIPESRLLLVLGCALPDTVAIRAEWGIDTIRVGGGP